MKKSYNPKILTQNVRKTMNLNALRKKKEYNDGVLLQKIAM